jgi:hypothetical protein
MQERSNESIYVEPLQVMFFAERAARIRVSVKFLNRMVKIRTVYQSNHPHHRAS